MQGRGPQVETPWSTQYVKLLYLRERSHKRVSPRLGRKRDEILVAAA